MSATFRLQHEEPNNYQTGSTKKNTCFAQRWKDIATCENKKELIDYAQKYYSGVRPLRIVDKELKVIKSW